MVFDFDRFVRNICKRAEFVKNLLKATCLTLRRLFRGGLLTGRIHCMCTKVAVKSIGNIAGASTKLTIFWGFEPLIGFNSL
jgi:hypothetical protein